MRIIRDSWRFFLAVLAAGFVVGLCDSLCGADQIRWPMTGPLPEPVADDPKPVETLNADEWLVVESDIELFVRRYPENVIEVESTTGPIRLRGKFAGGGGRVETRTIGGDHVYFLTSVSSGKVCVDLIPVGLTTEVDIVRHVLTVVDGTKPNPPPKPEPGPDPKPEPIPSGPVLVEIVEDTRNRSPETAMVLNALVGWTEFTDAGNDWRIYDQLTKEPRGIVANAAIKAVGQQVPAMIITDKSTKKVKVIRSLPNTFEEFREAAK